MQSDWLTNKIPIFYEWSNKACIWTTLIVRLMISLEFERSLFLSLNESEMNLNYRCPCSYSTIDTNIYIVYMTVNVIISVSDRLFTIISICMHK